MNSQIELQEYIHSLVEATVGSRTSDITNVLRKTGERYIFVPEALVAAKGYKGDIIALEKSFKYDKAGQIADWNPDFMPEGKGWIHGKDLRIAEKSQSNFYELSPEVASYGRTHIELNDSRLVHHNNWLAAQESIIKSTLELGMLLL